jgi:hypothetical protein
MVMSQLDFELFSRANQLGSNSSLTSLNIIHHNTKYIETTALAINLFCNVNEDLTLQMR